MTAEEKALEIVRKHCDARGSFLKQDEENLVRLISEALQPAPPSPTEEELKEAAHEYRKANHYLVGIGEAFEAGVLWALKRNKTEQSDV